jgi:hypothetical protein
VGLGDGIGQKKPCHHLGPFFSNFLLEKILGYLKEFLRKKLKSAKKVTKLPALTVRLFCCCTSFGDLAICAFTGTVLVNFRKIFILIVHLLLFFKPQK